MKAMGSPKGVPGIPESIFKPENFVFPVFDYDWGPQYDHSEAAGDPRLSLEEPYGTHAGYVAAVTKAANNADQKGYLLAADRDALIQQAVDSDVCNQPGDGGKCNP
jgi:hypothetical protein